MTSPCIHIVVQAVDYIALTFILNCSRAAFLHKDLLLCFVVISVILLNSNCHSIYILS